MGNLHTFIIKILWDHHQPRALRGQLTCVANGEKYAFAEGEALLELLHRILNREMVDLSSPVPGEGDNLVNPNHPREEKNENQS